MSGMRQEGPPQRAAMSEAPRQRALDRVLRPRAIAVLGASAREGALSSRFTRGLLRHGFNGRIVPVNPRYKEIEGLRCHPTIASAVQEGQVDLAVVSLPGPKVLEALQECAQAQLAGAVIFSSGFGEVGQQGRAAQDQLSQLSAQTGLRLIGPNSPGFINVTDSTCLIASGVSFRERFEPGAIAIVAQSGGVAGLLIERAQDAGAGISKAICTGNEADLTVGEVLLWLAEDEQTRVVAAFVEGLRKTDLLLEGFRALRAAGKPLLMLKAGATEAAARATAAHTGALASADDVVDAVLARHHVARVYGFDELIDSALALDRLGTATGRRVGIVTTSGGAGVVATEAAERAGLSLPPLSDSTRARLQSVLPDFASLQNPADMSGMFVEDREIFLSCLAAFSETQSLDASVLVLTVHPQALSEELADRLIEHKERSGPWPAVLWTAGAMSEQARARLREAGLAVFEDADRCMGALSVRAIVGGDPQGAAVNAGTREPAPLPPLPTPSLPEGPLTEAQALGALQSAGIPIAEGITAANPEAAAEAARRLSRPLVVKASAPDLPHKSDAGAVILGVEEPRQAAAAHEQVVKAAAAAGAHPQGSLLQVLAEPGVELIVGVRRDEDFGLILVVGPGGIAAELASSVSRRMLPLLAGEAEEMLAQLPISPLLGAHRRAPRADIPAAVHAIETLSRFALAIGDQLEAVEINPLIVHPEGSGVTAVDALILRAEKKR